MLNLPPGLLLVAPDGLSRAQGLFHADVGAAGGMADQLMVLWHPHPGHSLLHVTFNLQRHKGAMFRRACESNVC